MDVETISLRGDWRGDLRAMFPAVTRPQLDAFARLVAFDLLISDEGEPAAALIDWCKAVTA